MQGEEIPVWSPPAQRRKGWGKDCERGELESCLATEVANKGSVSPLLESPQ